MNQRDDLYPSSQTQIVFQDHISDSIIVIIDIAETEPEVILQMSLMSKFFLLRNVFLLEGRIVYTYFLLVYTWLYSRFQPVARDLNFFLKVFRVEADTISSGNVFQ